MVLLGFACFYCLFMVSFFVMHIVVEKYCGSQGVLLSQNRWSVSQEGSRAKDVDRYNKIRNSYTL